MYRRANAALDCAELPQVRGQLVRLLSQLTRELAKLLGESRSRVVCGPALVLEVAGDRLDALCLARGRVADVTLLCDDGGLRVRQCQDGDEQGDRGDRRDRGVPRIARLEQPWRYSQHSQRVAPLTA